MHLKCCPWRVRLGCSFVTTYRSKITTNKINGTFCIKEEKKHWIFVWFEPAPIADKARTLSIMPWPLGHEQLYHRFVSIIGQYIRKLGGILTLIFFHLIQNHSEWKMFSFSCSAAQSVEERKAESKALIQSRFYCDLFSLEPPPPSFLHFVNQFGKNFTGWFWKNWHTRSSQEIWVTNHLPN